LEFNFSLLDIQKISDLDTFIKEYFKEKYDFFEDLKSKRTIIHNRDVHFIYNDNDTYIIKDKHGNLNKIYFSDLYLNLDLIPLTKNDLLGLKGGKKLRRKGQTKRRRYTKRRTLRKKRRHTKRRRI